MQFKKGDRVFYNPKFGAKENGIVKSVSETHAFVVYKCSGNWEDYQNYTGVNTSLAELKSGWVDEKGDILPEYCDHYYINDSFKWGNPNRMSCSYCGNVINN